MIWKSMKSAKSIRFRILQIAHGFDYSNFTIVIIATLSVQQLQVRNRKCHHLPQRESICKDISFVCDNPILQGFLGVPRLRPNVMGLWIAHWGKMGLKLYLICVFN